MNLLYSSVRFWETLCPCSEGKILESCDVKTHCQNRIYNCVATATNLSLFTYPKNIRTLVILRIAKVEEPGADSTRGLGLHCLSAPSHCLSVKLQISNFSFWEHGLSYNSTYTTASAGQECVVSAPEYAVITSLRAMGMVKTLRDQHERSWNFSVMTCSASVVSIPWVIKVKLV